MKILKKILHHHHNMREATRRRTKRKIQSLSLDVTNTYCNTKFQGASVLFPFSLLGIEIQYE
jgi:hypothetical protein